jgi:hypothetical protein
VVQKDSYNSTGCFDLTCHGFVQIASEFAIGSSIGPYSSPFNQQYEINVGIFWVMIIYVFIIKKNNLCVLNYSHISIELS